MLSNELTDDLERILNRLTKSEEFAFEIDRMGLNPWSVVSEVARDPAVQARALTEYEPIVDLQEQLEVHKNIQPQTWPEYWQPSIVEVRFLLSGLIAAVASFLFPSLTTAFLWTPLTVSLTFLFIAASATLLIHGLPQSARDRLRWQIDHLRLIAGIATRWRETKRVLRDEVLIPELRGWIGGQMSPEFSTTLELRDSRGLMMPPGQGPLVPTAAVRACSREINRGMPAAVGIAGSRGAGKTTIIDRAIRNEITEPERDPVLGILTTAPVRYDARDFVLHVHASACRAVLDELSTVHRFRSSESERLWVSRFRLYQLRSAIADWLIAAVRVSGYAGSAVGIALLTWGWHGDHGEETLRRASTLVQESLARPRDVSFSQLPQLLALVLIAAGLLIALWITLRRLVSPLCRIPYLLLIAVVNGLHRRSRPAEAALKAVARQHLRRIRFLQTRTTGWSGKVAGIGGLELAPTRSTANAEQPLTYPEVVDQLRDFLRLTGDVLITRTGTLSALVIAIDELDKIADPEEAHRFLNDIKGIFGIPHCIYLVSVSEDALAAFERRGMPARDAFDSAFTSMLRVDPFTLPESQQWLAYRALGMPKPFVWLCHCLSGGLPRDLARVAIAVHDLSSIYQSLSDFTRAIVATEIQVKSQAYIHAARQLADQDDCAHALLEHLDILSRHTNAATQQVISWKPSDNSASPGLIRLHNEIQCYLTFCETLREVFTDHVDERLEMPYSILDPRSSIELLAEIRRKMSVNTPLASTKLANFRRRGGFTPS